MKNTEWDITICESGEIEGFTEFQGYTAHVYFDGNEISYEWSSWKHRRGSFLPDKTNGIVQRHIEELKSYGLNIEAVWEKAQ